MITCFIYTFYVAAVSQNNVGWSIIMLELYLRVFGYAK